MSLSIEEVLKKAWRLLGERRELWGLGLLATAVAVAFEAGLGYAMGDPNAWLAIDPAALVALMEPYMADTAWQLQMLGVAAVVLLLAWLSVTVAEGGLISAVAAPEPLGFGAGVRAGARLLWRFVLIDTVLFLPLFLILLTVLLAFSGTLIWAATQADALTGEAILRRFGTVVLCTIPLGCLGVPVLVLTLLGRVVAFRTAVLEDLDTRSALRRTAVLVRQYAATFLILGVLLVALRMVSNLLLSLVMMPITAVGGTATEGVAQVLFGWPLAALLFAYVSACWTVALGVEQGAMSKEQ